jgi:hypothetical protein
VIRSWWLPGAVLVGTVGFLTTFIAIVFALLPPEGTENPWLFEAKLLGGCLLVVLLGLALYLKGRRRA